MASPQVEHGHTRVAHTIMEALVSSSLSGAQLRLTLWILRLTYGFQRKEVVTNPNALATKCKTTGKYVCELLTQLEGFSVITAEWVSKDICKIKFNKDFEKWKCSL